MTTRRSLQFSTLLFKSCHKKQKNGRYFKNRELKNTTKVLSPLKGALNQVPAYFLFTGVSLYLQALLLITFSTLTFSVVTCGAYELLLGTGEVGSFSHFAGRTICRAVNKHTPDVMCRPIPAPDNTHNLTNIQSGSLDVALVNSKFLQDAISHSGYFKFLDINYDNLRLLLPIYRLPITLVVRRGAGIATLKDLRGKRVNGGAPLSMQELIFSEIMATLGWHQSDFSLYQSLSSAFAQDIIAFNNGTVQAMLHVGVHPDEKLERHLSHSRSTLVAIKEPEIDSLIHKKNGFCKSFVAAGTYSGVSNELDTLALETMLITNEDTEDSVVNTILAAIFAAREQLQQAHSSFLAAEIDISSANASEKIIPHPAVALYMQEKGMVK